MADLNYYINKIKFQITGGVLESEMPDEGYTKAINIALEEIGRYYNATQLVQVGASGCIDLNEVEKAHPEERDSEGRIIAPAVKISSVSAVYRTKPNGVTTNNGMSSDPMALTQWNMANNYYNYGTSRWIYNYMAYNTTNQIANTLSTDLDFKEDKLGRKLYVNFSNGTGADLVIEYVPKLSTVEDIVGEYWIDILSKLALAYTKIAIGRIRTRYTQDNALWKQDGDVMLEEGNSERAAIIERLQTQACFTYPLD